MTFVSAVTLNACFQHQLLISLTSNWMLGIVFVSSRAAGAASPSVRGAF